MISLLPVAVPPHLLSPVFTAMGDFGKAAVLGVLEGLTEFLPISSTGHMVLLGDLIDFTGDAAKTFEIVIQLGAILAVLVLYWKRFVSLLRPSAGAGLSGPSGLKKIAIACVPLVIVGFLFAKPVKAYLLAPIPVCIALIFGGIVLLFIDRKAPAARTISLDQISNREALIMGLFQCLALWPGISRSGSMIVGGLILGLNRITAAEFSFLVALPIMSLATAHELWKARHDLHSGDMLLLAVGFAVAFVTALAALRWFLKVLQRFTLVPFGWYRIALGAGGLLYFLAR